MFAKKGFVWKVSGTTIGKKQYICAKILGNRYLTNKKGNEET